MYYIFGKEGIKLPRTAHEQQAYATPVTTPAPGDLVFYGYPAHHVGLYIGGGKMIDAPGTGQRVQVESVGHPTSYGRVPGVGGVLSPVTDALGGAASWLTDITGLNRLLAGG